MIEFKNLLQSEFCFLWSCGGAGFHEASTERNQNQVESGTGRIRSGSLEPMVGEMSFAVLGAGAE